MGVKLVSDIKIGTLGPNYGTSNIDCQLWVHVPFYTHTHTSHLPIEVAITPCSHLPTKLPPHIKFSLFFMAEI
jgi:hypothetical protein